MKKKRKEEKPHWSLRNSSDDDVIIFSRTFEEQLEHIKGVFDLPQKENIKFKLSKCQFAKQSVKYLGFEID